MTQPWPSGCAEYVTDYTYSELGHLLTVTMPRPGLGTNPATVTQTRTWTYDLTGSTPTLRLLSMAHPEWKAGPTRTCASTSLIRTGVFRPAPQKLVDDINESVKVIGSLDVPQRQTIQAFNQRTLSVDKAFNGAGKRIEPRADLLDVVRQQHLGFQQLLLTVHEVFHRGFDPARTVPIMPKNQRNRFQDFPGIGFRQDWRARSRPL